MNTYRVLVSDKLAPEGLERFKRAKGLQIDVKVGMKPEELLACIGEYHALAIRSATKVTRAVLERGTKLRVVGRAGIGVDNIDVEAATQRGIIVMNTPDGNVVTTAEHAIALMCALTRHIPQATASMRGGQWEKTKFEGRELYMKSLGVLGLGNIGKIVADRALGLRMKVLAFDPFVTPEKARELGVELVTLEQLLARSDYLTLHVPLVEGTRNIISAAAIAKMKPGAFLINAARGGLADEAAVAEAVKSGRLGGAAFDVYETEPMPAEHPFRGVERIILTPHLGASTEEAQTNVSVAVADQIIELLLSGAVRNAINAPSVSGEHLSAVAPYVQLGRRLGKLAAQLHGGSVRTVRMVYHGTTAELPVAPVSTAMLAGMLQQRLAGEVNDVNAPLQAKERGIECVEEKTSTSYDFAAAIGISIEGDEGKTRVLGALLGQDEMRVVQINDVRLDFVPQGHLLMTEHQDRPGMIGRIGTVLGEAGINISRMSLAKTDRGEAEAVLSIGAAPNDEVRATLTAIPGIRSLRIVELG